jgi:hypothetical protein
MTQQTTNELALKKCGGSSSCILLYEGKSNVAHVELVVQNEDSSRATAQQAAVTPATNAPTRNVDDASQPVTQIRVTLEIKEQLDSYIKNCRSNTAYVCYLYVKKTGDAFGFKKIDANWFSARDTTRRSAQRECGAAGECVMVIEDGRESAVEIVTP